MVKYMVMCCYGRFNSFRRARVGMQEITEFFGFIPRGHIEY